MFNALREAFIVSPVFNSSLLRFNFTSMRSGKNSSTLMFFDSIRISFEVKISAMYVPVTAAMGNMMVDSNPPCLFRVLLMLLNSFPFGIKNFSFTGREG